MVIRSSYQLGMSMITHPPGSFSLLDRIDQAIEGFETEMIGNLKSPSMSNALRILLLGPIRDFVERIIRQTTVCL
jgi:hypothetical protein